MPGGGRGKSLWIQRIRGQKIPGKNVGFFFRRGPEEGPESGREPAWTQAGKGLEVVRKTLLKGTGRGRSPELPAVRRFHPRPIAPPPPWLRAGG